MLHLPVAPEFMKRQNEINSYVIKNTKKKIKKLDVIYSSTD